ncbi:dystrophin-like [Topomyia yanbarensis]|uniref:dystrophin-like n=1 Tax=Topomyia yanbarensis TaxID=2498891 RepID=UPI00273B3A1F|nr:dystrophin-like [Topomyia yanbarensis]
MHRKIALNDGNELRIDNKNISLHINNPFVTTFVTQHQQQQKCDTAENMNSGCSLMRPRRPYSIAVEPQSQRLKNNEVKCPCTNWNEKNNLEHSYNVIYYPVQKHSDHPPSSSPVGSIKSINQDHEIYTQPLPVTAHSNAMISPVVSQTRSQSIPRQNGNKGIINNLPILRPSSLDRNTPLGQHSTVSRKRMTQPGSSTDRISNGIGIRQSATFHGQPADPGVVYSNMSDLTRKDVVPIERKQIRPVSFAYGTVPDQIFLEKQLQLYSEQLRTITESVKRFSEQAKLLQELKKQNYQPSQNNSTVGECNTKPQRIQPSPAEMTDNERADTPSHQLKLFLESIRSSMREPEKLRKNDNEDDRDNDIENNTVIENVEQEAYKPCDQLRKCLDSMRSKHVDTEHSNIQSNTSESTTQRPYEHVSTNSEFEKKVDNSLTTGTNSCDDVNKKNQKYFSFDTENKEKLSLNIAKTSKTVDQILDKFHLLAMNAKSADSVEYLKKCSDALKQTSEQINLFNMAYASGNNSSFYGANNHNNAFDDTQSSTTPGSIREAVQSLLTQPRNGFQIMDDRMALFIDILDTQDKFSQVIEVLL